MPTLAALMMEHASGTPDELFDAFVSWAADEKHLELYEAQQEALLEIVDGSNVIMSTPTGSGKSMVALGAHAVAFANGTRTAYTAPIKALVSEKFFALVGEFGAANVGMVTGDSSVNPDAPIICCTAEILANQALRNGTDTGFGQVVMDEFHFYADRERGWAWQVPLLLMTTSQFILLSATLGDTTALAADLTKRTSRPTAEVTSVARPVPLEYSYSIESVQETIERLLGQGKAPIYVVHFAQAAAIEQAQALTSINVASRAQRDDIAAAIGGFRFTTGFGSTLSRLVRAGIGVHHAGMLPRYRRLVEQLAQQGLLRVICGTDTLGVGINVPIRTVLLSALTKFDGVRMRRLTVREFHQIAGRAGRAGYDVEGDVVAEAPEYEIENHKAELKAAARDAGKTVRQATKAQKSRRLVKKQAPKGFVSWSEGTFDRLRTSTPETLTGHMVITHSMMLNVVARGRDAFATIRTLVFDNHEPRVRQFELARRALEIARTLLVAHIVEIVDDPSNPGGPRIPRLTVDLQPNFALNQPLSPFALAALELFDPEAETYALDVVSVIEATLDDPRAILNAQEHMARGEAIAAMKADGIDYDERMELLDAVTYPKPDEELLDAAYESYCAEVPWARDFELRPKSVVRDLFERAMTFRDYVGFYGLARSEGLVLRYLSDAYRALVRTVPNEKKTDQLRDMLDWLGDLVRGVDSSLLDEWTALAHPESIGDGQVAAAPPKVSRFVDGQGFVVLVRNQCFRRVQLAALGRYAALGELDGDSGFTADRWREAMDAYFDDYESLGVDADARNPALLTIDRSDADDGVWHVRQTFSDPDSDHDWGIAADVDLSASEDAGEAVLHVTAVGPFGQST